MKLVLQHELRGYRALCVMGDRLLLARRNALYLSDLDGGSRRLLCSLPDTRAGWFASRLRITRRLLRHGVHCAIPLDAKHFLVSFRRGIYRVDAESGAVALERDFSEGFRPLAFARIEDVPGVEPGVYYGEYDGRITRAPIRIFARSSDGDWRVVHTFKAGDVDHIHSLVPDPQRGCVWILAGDYGEAASIWQARRGFAEVVPVLRGEQTYRTSTVFPVPEGLLYATDSHIEANSLRVLSEEAGTWRTRELRPMYGSCVYACRVGERYFFSTAVEPGLPSPNPVRYLLDMEPGPGIQGPNCEIVGGSLDAGFETLARWRVDWLPKNLFQFSTIQFPAGVLPADRLITYGAGIVGRDDTTEIYSFES